MLITSSQHNSRVDPPTHHRFSPPHPTTIPPTRSTSERMFLASQQPPSRLCTRTIARCRPNRLAVSSVNLQGVGSQQHKCSWGEPPVSDAVGHEPQGKDWGSGERSPPPMAGMHLVEKQGGVLLESLHDPPLPVLPDQGASSHAPPLVGRVAVLLPLLSAVPHVLQRDVPVLLREVRRA